MRLRKESGIYRTRLGAIQRVAKAGGFEGLRTHRYGFPRVDDTISRHESEWVLARIFDPHAVATVPNIHCATIARVHDLSGSRSLERAQP
jgi:hypothetical protein